ncbi:hypothetical protein [Aliihoeflea sp. PC F10.4]
MKLDLYPIESAPNVFEDGRECLACDFLGTWRVVKFDRNVGWVYYNTGDEPFSSYPYETETITPVFIAELPHISDVEPANVDA